MKILIYSDLHCSYTSSIMPIYCNDSIYTTRLKMIIDTGKWISEIAKSNNVDYIVNGGDTFDSNHVRAEEISAMSDFFSYFDDSIPHIIISGNHEILDKDSKFHSAKLFNNMKNIHVYNKPCKINNLISVLPYMRSEDIDNNLLKSIGNKFLISHIDIKGSHLRPDYIMDSGVNPELLSEYFMFVANGHLHTAEKIDTSKNVIWNIGSVTSTSFVDNNNYIPSICIYDSDNNSIDRIFNPNAILFRRYNINSINDMLKLTGNLDSNYKYILRITCPYDIKDSIRDIISEKDNIITCRIISDNCRNGSNINLSLTNKIDSRSDIKTEFIKFIESNKDVINYPIDEYMKVISFTDQAK